MRKVLNYLGQLRIYSLVDLILMLVAAGASPASLRFWGAVDYWVGFLAHLESVHHDKGREPVPSLIPWLLWLQAAMTWKNDDVGYLFISLSFIYAWKKRKPWGLISPFVRGLQTLVLLGAIPGYRQWLPWVGALAVGLRNWAGDQRDVEEDREDGKDGVQTWPVLMGQKKDRPFIHLFGVLATTWLWWWFSSVSWLVPLGINIIEVSTYWLTPRPSNKNAAAWLHSKILYYIRR